MLAALRNREHIVATGVALADVNGCVKAATSRTRVRMRNYSDAEIARYVATGDPLDKAGAYSIQHPDFEPVERVSGCYLGVMGLPMCLVASLLQRPEVPAAGNCPWSGCLHCSFPDVCEPGLASTLRESPCRQPVAEWCGARAVRALSNGPCTSATCAPHSWPG